MVTVDISFIFFRDIAQLGAGVHTLLFFFYVEMLYFLQLPAVRVPEVFGSWMWNGTELFAVFIYACLHFPIAAPHFRL